MISAMATAHCSSGSAGASLSAPIFLLAVCVGFYFWDIKTNPVVMIVFLWGVWHGMMQTYGFGRIYDAKTGSFAALTRRLDFATCGIWFAAGVILSPARMTDTLEGFYGCGLPFISPGGIHALQQTLLFAAVAVSILWLANYGRMWVAGTRQNPVKLALFITSVAFWWYCNNGVANILAGIALFEVFHDVQYLSWFGFTTVTGSRKTARSVGSCDSFSVAADP